MNRLKKVLCAAVYMLLVLCLTACAKGGAANEISREGTAEKFGNIKVLNLYGSWYEMGQQYGRLAKEELTNGAL